MKNFVAKIGIVVCLLSVFALFGCATLPHPDEMKTAIATYQLPKLPESGKAIVYVVRPASIGALIRFNK